MAFLYFPCWIRFWIPSYILGFDEADKESVAYPKQERYPTMKELCYNHPGWFSAQPRHFSSCWAHTEGALHQCTSGCIVHTVIKKSENCDTQIHSKPVLEQFYILNETVQLLHKVQIGFYKNYDIWSNKLYKTQSCYWPNQFIFVQIITNLNQFKCQGNSQEQFSWWCPLLQYQGSWNKLRTVRARIHPF